MFTKINKVDEVKITSIYILSAVFNSVYVKEDWQMITFCFVEVFVIRVFINETNLHAN